jgi:hypothetical protein
LDVYGHVSETMRRDGADRMERFIEQAQNAASNDPSIYPLHDDTQKTEKT